MLNKFLNRLLLRTGAAICRIATILSMILFLQLYLSCSSEKEQAIYQSIAFTIYKDSVIQDNFTARILSDHEIHSDYHTEAATLKRSLNGEEKKIASSWKLSKDISAFPQYQSDYPISNALYNMALEEMINAVEPDSTFRTGKEWAGVWTRDISYSILLSMATLQPKVAVYSLLRKVNARKRIIQDTGTGGAWPVSSDRMIWAVAAWEVYKVTGDADWLQQSYIIIKNSLEDDLNTLYDPATGMVKGESSFLDWREQTYPAWMQPADIFESENLGTNAVHYEANRVLSRMASLLGDTASATKHRLIADKIREGINIYLWMPEQQYYAQYLYGRLYKMPSPRAEALGEALCVLFDIADSARQHQIVAHTPVTSYGIPCIFPQIPDIPPYHNNAVWPFVQSFWLWAAAKTGNEKMVMESISAIYRPAALFVTNKENFVADNGDFSGTEINSSNMLWSLSGNLSIVYKVLFGISLNESGLHLTPFVPERLKGHHRLSNYQYRDMLLDIELEGWGNQIKSFSLDGKKISYNNNEQVAFIPATTRGSHKIKIQLSPESLPEQSLHKTTNYTSPATPSVTLLENGLLSWQPVKNAVKYKVMGNGNLVASIQEKQYAITNRHMEYQVIAVDSTGIESFASEPVTPLTVFPTENNPLKNNSPENSFRKDSAPGNSFLRNSTTKHYPIGGDKGLEISSDKNRQFTIPVQINAPGRYALDFYYANGNGPVNTENKCAVRTLRSDSLFLGAVVFPQRGKDNWKARGFSNAHIVHLSEGAHQISLRFEPWNENMNGTVNQAVLYYLRVIPLE